LAFFELASRSSLLILSWPESGPKAKLAVDFAAQANCSPNSADAHRHSTGVLCRPEFWVNAFDS
jgi:hypothetical protein